MEVPMKNIPLPPSIVPKNRDEPLLEPRQLPPVPDTNKGKTDTPPSVGNQEIKIRPLPIAPKVSSSKGKRNAPKQYLRSTSRVFGTPKKNSLITTPKKSATTDSIPSNRPKTDVVLFREETPPKNVHRCSGSDIPKKPSTVWQSNILKSQSETEIAETKALRFEIPQPLTKDSTKEKPQTRKQRPVKRSSSESVTKSKNRNTLHISTSFMKELKSIMKSPSVSPDIPVFSGTPSHTVDDSIPPAPPLPTKKDNKDRKDKLKKEDESIKRKKRRGCKAYVRENLESYNELTQLLMLNGFMMIRLLDPFIKRKDLEKASKAFLSLLSYKEVILDYIKGMIKREIDASTSEGTLFRTNNLCTGIMSAYSMRIGKGYLIKVLKPCFDWLSESSLDFEVDPNHVDKPEDVKKNTFNLNYLINKFFKAILNSVEFLPFELREISSTLQMAVIKKYPNSLYTAVGGFFFLRFVVPAVINPEGLEILVEGELDPKFKRPLTLVAKTLQQIANNQKFNEPHMEALNDLITKSSASVHSFFDQLVQKDKIALEKERERILEKMRDQEVGRVATKEIDHKSFVTAHRYLQEHIDEIALKTGDVEKTLGYDPAVEIKALFENMGELPDEKTKKKTLSYRATAFFGKIQLKGLDV